MFMNGNEEEATRMNLQMGILFVCQVFESRSIIETTGCILED